ALSLESLVVISGVAPRQREQEPLFVAPELPPPARSRWLVHVDGWTIALDGVRGLVPQFGESTAAHRLAAAPDNDSPFHQLIVPEAAAEGLDWRLVSAVIATESAFDPVSESEAGAYGLMQVRPIAARDVLEKDFHSPADNIRTGVRYLKKLMETFPGAN